jgi:hypothetical protein
MFARTAKSCRTAPALGECVNDIKRHLNDRDDYELGDALERFELEQLIAAIPDRNKYLALVVRIDQANEISQNDTVLVAQSRSRQDHRRQPRVRKVYRNSAWNEFCLARADREHIVEAGAQVQACRARSSVCGHLVSQAWVKNANIYLLRHAFSGDTVNAS